MTVKDADAEQLPFEPVTLYVVVADGLITILAVVSPVLQTYEEPPIAVSVADAPSQIADADAFIIIAGDALTNTVPLADELQPLPFVPVTLYVVVEPGLTVILAVVAPLLHT